MGGKASKQMTEICIDMSTDKIKRYFNDVWYEQARYYMLWEEGCVDATATYSLQEDGSIEIINQCDKYGIQDGSKGKGRHTFPEMNKGSFEVSFAPGTWCGYYIIYLQHEESGDKRGLSIVVGDSFKYMWVLTRKENLSVGDKKNICELLDTLHKEFSGIDKSKLIWNDGKSCF